MREFLSATRLRVDFVRTVTDSVNEALAVLGIVGFRFTSISRTADEARANWHFTFVYVDDTTGEERTIPVELRW